MPTTWKSCSSCKKPIAHGGLYFRCSVSTCNSGGFQLAFCSVDCWDAHVPSMNHRRDVWAIEERVPGPGPEPERRVTRGPAPPRQPDEVLIVASRLKDFIRARSGYNCSADVMEVLSDKVREATVDAIDHARAEGRKTVMGRDFRRD